MQPVRPDRVAIYIRWSTDDQGDGTTAQVQLEGCRHYLLSQGWACREELVFVDDGYSGGDLNRPALARLRAAVSAGQVDCVVVFKIDRLSRNVVDTVNLVLREWEGRAYVKSAREPIDTTSPAGKMFFYTLVSFAEWERSVIRERTMGGKLRRLQEGRNPGFRPPYGLTTGQHPGTFLQIPEEAKLVRWIFARALAGCTPQAIARELAGQSVLFRSGRPFTARAVTTILKNPIYAGRLAYGRRVANPRRHAGQGRQVKNPNTPLIVTATTVPPTVDGKQFDAVQGLLTDRGGRAVRNGESVHLLTGVLRCRCGGAVSGVRTHGGGYYVCATRRSQGAGACAGGHIREADLDQWVTQRLLQRIASLIKERRDLSRRSLPDMRIWWQSLARSDQKRLLRQWLITLTAYRAPRSRRVECRLTWAAGAASDV